MKEDSPPSVSFTRVKGNGNEVLVYQTDLKIFCPDPLV